MCIRDRYETVKDTYSIDDVTKNRRDLYVKLLETVKKNSEAIA